MKYDAVAFLEGLFRRPGGGPDVKAGALPASRAHSAVTVADLPPDWHLLWDERAAIMEYDGGLPREHAEAQALADIIAQMRRAGDLPRT
jgi:hypothetical protein